MIDDKKKKFEELSEFIKGFDNRVATQWEEWKNELYDKLESMCKTQEELDEVIELIKKQNIGGITEDAFLISSERLENDKFFFQDNLDFPDGRK